MVRVTDPNTGKRRAAYFDSEAGALKALRRMATRAESGEVVLAAGATLRTWVDAWLPERAGRRRRASTVHAYAYRLRTYVLPEIGGVRLRELTALDVDDLAHTLADRGLSASTIKGALVALAACLADAHRGRLIGANPASGVEVPEVAPRTREVTAPTVEQVRGLLTKVKGTDLEPLVDLLVATGARIGEALGATWGDIDLEAGVWTVASTTTLTATGGVVVGERTKTSEGRRLTLLQSTTAQLRQQRRRVSALRLKAGPMWRDHDLVFPSSIGTPQHSANVRKPFREAASAAGFPGSFHALRHFVATVGLSSLPVAVVSKQLGHRRSTLTTDTYGHLLADDSATLAALVSALVSSEDSGT
jgi:integrase